MADFPSLTDGETIVWDGRPDTKLRFGMETLATGIGAAALILACLGLATVINRSYAGTFWLIFAPGVITGAFIVLAYPLIDASSRRKTRYRLTNKRAMIAGARSVQSYPIPPLDDLIYRDGTPPSIYFATRPPTGSQRRRLDVGFERIAQARDIFPQMRALAQDIHG